MRIYLFSGLRPLEINHWWMKFVEEHVLSRICEAIRREYGLLDPETLPVDAREIDLCRMFHSGIFHYGMRRELYGAHPALNFRSFIAASVDALLGGFPDAAARLLRRDESPAEQRPRRARRRT